MTNSTAGYAGWLRITSLVAVCLLFFQLTLACARRSSTSGTARSAAPTSGENYPNLAARARELEEALGRKDYAKVIDLTYPKLVEFGGGREKLLGEMTKEMKSMEAEGVEIISSKTSSPSQYFHDANTIYAVVPVTSKLKAKDGIFQTEGSLIGISSDKGANWTFVDASTIDQTELKKILPNLDKLNLPAEKGPVKVAS